MFKDRKEYKVFRERDGGYIMMLAMIVMLTLTVIAVGYVTNVILETSIVRNYRVNRDTLNAAEAGLEVAMKITHEEITTNLEPFSGTTRTAYQDENVTKYGYPFQVLFDDLEGVQVTYRVIPENPDPQKNRFLYRSYVSCQEMIHFAYPYIIEVVAKPLAGEGGTEYLKRQIRVLETPLVQYFIFFDGDLPWHPGPEMNSWGRVHTNGNIWFSPDGNVIWLKNFTVTPGGGTEVKVQHFLTASGVIYQDRLLGPNPPWARNGRINVKVYNLDTNDLTAAHKCRRPTDGANCDYVEINSDITSANAQAEQARFTDTNGCSYVLVGVPKSPAISFNALFRGGFYERKARAPERSEYFGLTIVIEGGGAGANWPPRTLADHSGTIHIYAATKDFAYDYRNYPNGVKIEDVTEKVFNAGDIESAGGDPLNSGHADDGSIIISPETVYHPLTAGIKFPASDTTAAYPVFIERNDQRQDMNGVALTVINLKRLEKWFYDVYLDYEYDQNDGNQTVAKFLTDEMTGNPTKLVIYVSRTPTVGEVPGWAGYTADSGPPYPYYARPNLPMTFPPGMANQGAEVLQAIKLWKTTELVCATTIASDNPVYVDGNFNNVQTKGCAVIGDTITLLSANWDGTQSGRTGGRPPISAVNMNAATETTYCASFFSGRDDLDTFAIRGGPYNEETEGIHNFLGFQENWGGVNCNVKGSLVNLWYTRQALGLFSCNSFSGCGTGTGNVYQPPTRNFGWDPGYQDPEYWPPYCPSAYSVEKVGWLEGTDYDEEFIWDPSKQ